MRCSLVNPPICDPSCPPLGLAYLSSVLEMRNIPHKVVDSNLDFMNFVDTFTTSALGRAEESSTSVFCRTQAGLKGLSRFFPNITIEHFDLRISPDKGNLANIRDAALAMNGLFSTWIRQSDPISAIIASDPDWIGLSVSFMGQLAAALAIASECKKKSKANIIFGGALFKDFEEWLGERTPFWDLVDGVVVGAGEDVIGSLKRYEDSKIRPTRWRRDLPGGGWIAASRQVAQALRPEFSRFPLERYRAKGLVLPYRVFPRCSWRKCTFCADAKYAGHMSAKGGKPTRVASELIFLAEKYGAEGIYFLDAELPARFMIECGKHMPAEILRWGANSRFTKALTEFSTAHKLYKAGCRFIRFGLESASPRVLKLMNKGVSSELAERVLATVHQVGIATHVYLMRGYPGELMEDWKITQDFLFRNAGTIDMFSISCFILYDGSPLSKTLTPDQIDITATESRWVHPNIVSHTVPDVDIEELEKEFFSIKETTRCYPNTADTILLGDSAPIRFGDKIHLTD